MKSLNRQETCKALHQDELQTGWEHASGPHPTDEDEDFRKVARVAAERDYRLLNLDEFFDPRASR